MVENDHLRFQHGLSVTQANGGRRTVGSTNLSRLCDMRVDILPIMAEGLMLSMTVLVGAFLPAALQAQTCESLAKRVSPAVSITLAKTIDHGTFTPTGSTETLPRLPVFCRVAASLKPTSDSDIRIEIWLPISDWNGKFLAVGSGGWGGSIAYDDMAEALRRGYATSATDDGHTGRGACFIVGHPEKFIDFAYRAEHEMTVEAKTLIKAFYGRDPRYSYWDGCSGGGREGLLQAYRYPDEFDGIVAGDPANVRRNAWALWLAVQTFTDTAAYIPPDKYPMIHRAVLDACDANDGLKDGLIEDPESCHVDFKALKCKAADGPDCLTPRQVQTAQTIISPATTPTGKVVFPRLEPGTELRWARLAGGPQPADLFLDQFRYVVYPDSNWDWRTFDLERDSAKADAVDKEIDDLDPHLASFAKHGGKLLIYHGWADQQVSPGSSIEFYKSVLNLSGDPAQAANWIRLFMAPGMGHCSGGEGPDTFDRISLIEQWVERGKAPAKIIAAHQTAGQVDRTRPLCPYPQVARYNGNGNTDDASNFTCSLPQ
jgi:feruloyl esterase